MNPLLYPVGAALAFAIDKRNGSRRARRRGVFIPTRARVRNCGPTCGCNKK